MAISLRRCHGICGFAFRNYALDKLKAHRAGLSDEWAAYRGIGAEFDGGHHVVNHSKGEYARGDAHTNTAEGYFALLKRGVMGSFHHVRYCNEFSFRWDHRKNSLALIDMI